MAEIDTAKAPPLYEPGVFDSQPLRGVLSGSNREWARPAPPPPPPFAVGKQIGFADPDPG